MHQAFAPMQQASPSVVSVLPGNSNAPTGDVSSGLDPEVAQVKQAILDSDPEFRHFQKTSSLAGHPGLLDWLIASNDEPHQPEHAFGRLRWGGQLVYVSRDRAQPRALAERYAQRGFDVTRGPAFVRMGWRIPWLSPVAHYFAARKTQLVPLREFSDRFTYQVELEPRSQGLSSGTPGTEGWVVRKEVPSFERVLARLKFKAPDLPTSILEKRARKFVEQIFPLFLTREAAMLKIIERDVPAEYARRFPRIVDLDKDGKGYVQRLWTTWVRNGGRPISQIEFARQSADLLHVLHDRIGIIHLDLRMDNMVITEHGVGFVDFGSAVRVNENIHGNAVLSTLFGELMRTSQIQRMLDRMATAGSVTSHVIRDAYQQVDKAVDLFYLAVQISQPTTNPDLRDLVQYDKFSPEAVELSGLTSAILRPSNPRHPRFRTARDVLDEIVRIEQDLRAGRFRQPAASALSPAPSTKPVAHSKPKVYIWK